MQRDPTRRSRSLPEPPRRTRLTVIQIDGFDADFLLQRWDFDERFFRACEFLVVFLFALVVASGIFAPAALDDFPRDAHDHAEPDKEDDLQEEEHAEEDPAGLGGPADHALGVLEGLEEVVESIWGFDGAVQVLVRAPVTSEVDFSWNIRVDGVAGPEVEEVSGDEPGNHEDAKGNVAGHAVL